MNYNPNQFDQRGPTAKQRIDAAISDARRLGEDFDYIVISKDVARRFKIEMADRLLVTPSPPVNAITTYEGFRIVVLDGLTNYVETAAGLV